ncbi:MAG: sialidase family protein, partial [Vicinamibacterales bacterium]
MTRQFTLGVASAAVLAAASLAGSPAQEWSLKIEAVPSPAAPGSGQPQLTVSDRGALLSWIERAGDKATLKFAERLGNGWSEARPVASGTDWFVNWADVPSVIRLTDGTLYAHWLQKSGPSTYAYDVQLSRSVDDGKTWAPSLTPHHDGTQTEHGFASLFQAPGAGLGLVWLDGRAMKAGGHDGHGGGGDMSVRAAAFDRTGKQTAETPVDLRVCECCPTAVAVTSEGPIVAYRDRSPNEIRDISISRLVGGQWTPPATVHADGWRI